MRSDFDPPLSDASPCLRVHSDLAADHRRKGQQREVSSTVSRSVKISIITATRNCADTVADCLASIDAQSYANREHVIIDRASTDATLAVACDQPVDIDLLVSVPDLGFYDALNKGLARSTGDVVGFLGADDIYADADVLARIAAAFHDSSVCAAYGDLQYVDRGNAAQVFRQWRSSRFIQGQLPSGWMPPHPTLYVRREWYERTQGFDTEFHFAANYHSILKLFAQAGFKAEYLESVLVKVRVDSAKTKSLRNLILKTSEDLEALRRTRVGGLRTLFQKKFSKISQFAPGMA